MAEYQPPPGRQFGSIGATIALLVIVFIIMWLKMS